MFVKNNIEKNVKERVLFKNYKERLNVRYIYGINVGNSMRVTQSL